MRLLAVILISWLSLPTFGAEDAFILLPAKFNLRGTLSRQQLLVEKVTEKGYAGQVTQNLTWMSSDTNIVTVENGVVRPHRNGTAKITVQQGNQLTTAAVEVAAMEKPVEQSFRNNVQPVLAKNGCNAGACHGAAAGQNGFKLSLRGYDDDGDYIALTRHSLGRRIIPSDPGRSLLLLKPSGALPHKGGKKFEVGSEDYQILADWVASGTPAPKNEDPRIDRIEITPDKVALRSADTQQLVIRAFFNDGHAEDVTKWVKYTSANTSVALVDDNGLVKVAGNGEGAITAWYLSRIAIATISVPYTNQLSSDIFANAPRRNFIDELVLAKLQDLNLPPSPRANDFEFIRRVYLDTIGMLPSSDVTRAFLADSSPGKRDALIETLLMRPEFVDYWTYKWSDLMLVSSKKLRPAAMWSYYNWIHNEVAANTPWDVLVRKIVTAQGSTLENGAANFFVLREDPRDMSETVSQAFLGMSINCAKCHNHPMEKWTNDQYYKMANLFARVRMKTGRSDGENIIFAADSGDLIQPLRGKPQVPAPLDGKPVPLESREDRRLALADWLVSRDNPYFSRSVVNRLWANFFGVGLVENVDDLRATNPASNEKLLSAAAAYLADHRFDVKEMMRTILQSETYQHASEPLPGNAADQRFFSHYYPKRLMAEVMLDAVSQVTAVPAQFKGYPSGWRAIQLPDSNVDSYFLKSFGRPERDKTCECERTANPSVTQVLHIANGDTVNKKLESQGGLVERLAGYAPEKIVEETYLAALCRLPSAAEKQKVSALFEKAAAAEKRPLVEDWLWAVLSSKEFLFNH